MEQNYLLSPADRHRRFRLAVSTGIAHGQNAQFYRRDKNNPDISALLELVAGPTHIR